ncbi:MAG: hypothetical protein P4L16_03875 [Chlamydiales bacterium]|nr:hypothetical protein [Chlamydiales bacterium]
MSSKQRFIRDYYQQKRGTPKMLLIQCSHCNNYLMHYQKDGPGPLLRCYIDRIYHPKSTSTDTSLTCSSCHTIIGDPIIYEKEQRSAYNLVPDSFIIKKTTLRNAKAYSSQSS